MLGYYLTKQERYDLIKSFKEKGYKQFHYTTLFYKCINGMILYYSYETYVAYRMVGSNIININPGAYEYSRTTTQQLKRLIKENNYKESLL